jgi:hypothetical protein
MMLPQEEEGDIIEPTLDGQPTDFNTPRHAGTPERQHQSVGQ